MRAAMPKQIASGVYQLGLGGRERVVRGGRRRRAVAGRRRRRVRRGAHRRGHPGAWARAAGASRRRRHAPARRPRRRPRRGQGAHRRRGLDAGRGRGGCARGRARPGAGAGPRPAAHADRARHGRRTAASTGDPIAVEHDVARRRRSCRSARPPLHTPGHTAGHLALLLPRDGGVLFAGDAATNLLRLGVGPIYEDVDEGMREPAPTGRPAVRDGPVRARAAAGAAGLRALPRALRPRLTRSPAPRAGRAAAPPLSLPKNRSLTPAGRVVS